MKILFYSLNVIRKKLFYIAMLLVYYIVKKFIIKSIIISFSSGLLSAIKIVIATSAESDNLLLPFINNKLFLSKKYKNMLAAIRLFPSTNE